MIPLSGRRGAGRSAIVDDGDVERVDRVRWFLTRQGYVYGNVRLGDGRRVGVMLHRFILGDEAGPRTDHRNLDRLDNRRENLRPATAAQNNRNTAARQHSRQPYKGVRARKRGTYSARIRVDGAEVYLGTFPTAEDAARAYDEAARRLFGSFALPNFAD